MSFVNYLNPYAWVMRLRRRLYRHGALKSHSADIPVISIGNLSTGGTGKTPMAIWLAQLINSEFSKQPAVILRGYKRPTKGQVVVSDGKHLLASLEQSGDEAQLIANELPNAIVICDEDRVQGCAKAHELGADVVLLDDAYQHLRVKRDLNILLINEREGIPPVLPFGRGREHHSALEDADIVIMTNSTSDRHAIRSKPALVSRTIISSVEQLGSSSAIEISSLKGHKLLALSAIGNPQGFETSLSGYDIVPHRLADHFNYDIGVLNDIVTAARLSHCDRIITTTKDAVKIRPIVDKGFISEIPILVAKSELAITDPNSQLHRMISKLLK
ncbi:MAG TPA: tetraacyldisaccharide 4'-kinase [Candidatus Kapabacteria bacterium]|nr:tetraacyldisaccharide 4'-kinase [Candidatus Kapabacteria bacterium]